jgi:hypothetical protein
VSRKLTRQFAECLEANMVSAERGRAASPAGQATLTGPAAKPSVVRAKPIGGIGLGLGAIWAAIVNLFRRLFGSRRA